mmetsp:Transcript_1447/g.1991  ORF Transcript_1447/g.1991 Transcript_1447/m.1991 type:complete len:240 (+) Transcript_1447:795-1514(+)
MQLSGLHFRDGQQGAQGHQWRGEQDDQVCLGGDELFYGLPGPGGTGHIRGTRCALQGGGEPPGRPEEGPYCRQRGGRRAQRQHPRHHADLHQHHTYQEDRAAATRATLALHSPALSHHGGGPRGHLAAAELQSTSGHFLHAAAEPPPQPLRDPLGESDRQKAAPAERSAAAAAGSPEQRQPGRAGLAKSALFSLPGQLLDGLDDGLGCGRECPAQHPALRQRRQPDQHHRGQRQEVLQE